MSLQAPDLTLPVLEIPCTNCNGEKLVSSSRWQRFWSEVPATANTNVNGEWEAYLEQNPAAREEYDRLCREEPEEFPCPECEGRGSIPTEDGRRLLAFVRKHSQQDA